MENPINSNPGGSSTDPENSINPNPGDSILDPGNPINPNPGDSSNPDISDGGTDSDTLLFTSNWVRQFGSEQNDQSYAIAIKDDQSIYLSGEINASTSQFTANAFLASYTSSGDQNWLEEVGGQFNDRIDGLALTPSGQLVGGGITGGVVSLDDGETSSAYLVKYSDNNEVFEIAGSPDPNLSDTSGFGVAVSDEGKIYQVGQSRDKLTLQLAPALSLLGIESLDGFNSIINVYDANGTFERSIDLNLTGNDITYNVAIDADQNVYFTGFTNGSIRNALELSRDELLQILQGNNPGALLQSEPFITKFSPTGEQLWFQTIDNIDFGEGEDIAIDSEGNVYVAGVFSSNLAGNVGQGNLDGFIAKYDTDGTRQWIKPIGTEGIDRVRITIDESDRLIAAGYTGGSIFGHDNLGGTDAWLAHLDADGNVMTSTQFGTDGFDSLWDVDTDASGHIYVTGSTFGSFGDENLGELDAWLAKYQLS